MKVFIEISKGSNIKYEYNKQAKLLEVDRILHSSMHYPQNYGYLPETLCEDGDELDVLVFTESLLPGTLVKCRPIGYIDMYDEKGRDEKLLCVALNDPKYYHVHDIKDINKNDIDQILDFFENYKNLEKNKWVKIKGIYNSDKSFELIDTSKKKFLQK